MKMLNAYAAEIVLEQWHNLTPEQIAKMITTNPVDETLVTEIRKQFVPMSDFMDKLKDDHNDLFVTLCNLITRDYCLYTEGLYVQVRAFHLNSNLELLKKEGIDTDNPITSMESLQSIIQTILRKIPLNIQLVWRTPGKEGVLYVDEKNFKQR